MWVFEIPEQLRGEDKFHHIDAGFLNWRLCMSVLRLCEEANQYFLQHQKPGNDPMTVRMNGHLLVTALLDCCKSLSVRTLLKAMMLGNACYLFRSTECLVPCLQIYDAARVCHSVELNLDFGKPITIAYHTKHIASDTGKMILNMGSSGGYVNSVVGFLHDKAGRFEIEPMVIGQPWFDHHRNGNDSSTLMDLGYSFGEILPEDIGQFSGMRKVEAENDEEWMVKMRTMPGEQAKCAIARLLSEPVKKDWAVSPTIIFRPTFRYMVDAGLQYFY